MRLGLKDAAATVLTGGAVGLYGAYLAEVDWGMWSNTRVLGVTTLVLGLGACAVGASADPTATPRSVQRIGGIVGGVAWISALWTIIFGTPLALGIAVGATMFLWLVTTVRRLFTPSRPAPASTARTPADAVH